jgi:F0F1-type ATP synthase assembly protein I
MDKPLKVFVHLTLLVVWLELYRSQHVALFAGLGAVLLAWDVMKISRRPLTPARRTLEVSIHLSAAAALVFYLARPQSTLAAVVFFGGACLSAFLSLSNQIRADRAQASKQPG